MDTLYKQAIQHGQEGSKVTKDIASVNSLTAPIHDSSLIKLASAIEDHST
jgi:hypothetical protein